jgi:hypothetical protein
VCVQWPMCTLDSLWIPGPGTYECWRKSDCSGKGKFVWLARHYTRDAVDVGTRHAPNTSAFALSYWLVAFS